MLRARSAATHTGVVRLTAANYSDLVLDAPRDYALVVLYTASDPRVGCAVCPAAARSLVTASRSYAAAKGVPLPPLPSPANNHSLATAPAAAYAAASDGRTTFFAVVDFKNGQEAFQVHDLRSVPAVSLWPATSKRAEYVAGTRVPLVAENSVAVSHDPVSAADILHLLRGETIPLLAPAGDRLGIAVLATAAAALLAAAIAADPANWAFFKRPWFWTLASYAIYALSISGFIGCIIKGTPLYGLNRAGKPEVFAGSSGHNDQYILEGVVMGLLNVGVGAAATCLYLLARSRTASTFVKLVGGALLLAICAAAFMRILTNYQAKTPWYRVSALLPQGLSTAAATAAATITTWAKRSALPWLQTHFAAVFGAAATAAAK